MTISLHKEFALTSASFLGMGEIVPKLLVLKGRGRKTEKAAFLYLNLSGNRQVLQSSFVLISFVKLQIFLHFKQSREDISVRKKLCS